RGFAAFFFARFLAKPPPPSVVPGPDAAMVATGKTGRIIEHSRGKTASGKGKRRWVNRPALAVALLAVCLTPAGCANPCAGEGRRAEEAFGRARERQADLYAPEAMKEATASLERARQECRKQSSRFLLLRSYRPAQALFETALRQAEKAASRS